MWTYKPLVVSLLLLLGVAGVGMAVETPLAVSPGDASDVAVVEARCPTFSWGAVEGAESYDLVVYLLDGAEEAQQVLQESFAGSVHGWTPSLDRCLERGDRYAWSVRAVGRKQGSKWSQPSLFQVAPGPSEAELEETLAVVRRYLSEAGAADGSGPQAATDSEAGADAGSDSEPTSSAREDSPEDYAVEPTQMTVDGGVVAGSFTGDGSTLTDLAPANLAAGTAAIDILGNAASATDSDTLDGIDSLALLQKTEVDTEAELEALLTDVTNVLTDSEPAALATALAADGLNCAGDEAAAGVDPAGNAQDCQGQADLTTVGIKNTRVGSGALASNTSGHANTASGYNALSSNTEGYSNTASGSYALDYNTTGDANTANGFGALRHNTEGDANTAMGEGALFSNTMAGYNTASGFWALFSNTEGLKNTASGSFALRDNTTGFSNTAIGHNALASNLDASFNTASGEGALFANTTGHRNTAIGAVAMLNNLTGYHNTAVGVDSLRDASTGNDNVAVGFEALLSNDEGSGNTAVGARSLRNNTTGTANAASGGKALFSNTEGRSNTASGYNALASNTEGSYNTASGGSALYSNIDGGNNTASGVAALFTNTTGSYNTAVGRNALQSNASGHYNVGIGSYAGSNTTGSSNILINSPGVAGESNTLRFGSGTGTAGRQLERTFINGVRGVTTDAADAIPVLIDSAGQLGTVSSSRRYKEDIDDIDDMAEVSERLLELRPVTFRYRKAFANGEKPVQFGLIAEEVAEVFPELVVYDDQGRPETVKYHLLSSLLLNELKKQAKLNREQAREMTELAALRERLAELEDVKARLTRLEVLETRPPRVAAVADRARSSPGPGER